MVISFNMRKTIELNLLPEKVTPIDLLIGLTETETPQKSTITPILEYSIPVVHKTSRKE